MSEMTDNRANRIIHEAMGLCWHEPYSIDDDQEIMCRHCDMVTMDEDDFNNPNYTDPTSYLEAIAWAKKQYWWMGFLNTLKTGGLPTERMVDIILDPSVCIPKLASYLEGREG